VASTVAQYLATLAHPIYPQRSRIIYAPDLATAQAYAAAAIKGTLWAIVSVALFSPQPQ